MMSASEPHETTLPQRRCRSALSPQRLLVVVVATALLLSTPRDALAQTRDVRANVDTGGLTVVAVAGWDGAVDRSMPIPISLEVGNFSGKDIDGRLILTDPSGGDRADLGEIYIGQGSTRTFSAIRDLSDWQECYLTLRQGREIMWRRELPLSTGRTFDLTANFALLIEAEGRRMLLPDDVTTGQTTAPTTGVAGASGRKVECLTAAPWQVPRHSGPLTAIQAIIFPEGADADALNPVQMEAVATWMCQGGTVFVRKTSGDLIDRLVAAAPLGVSTGTTSKSFSIRHAGLGAIYEYSGELLAGDNSEQRDEIARVISKLSRTPAGALLPAVPSYYRRSGNSDYNRLLVLAFFGVYTLLSGVVSLMLFRLNRRRIATYTVTVVLSASAMAAVLGVVLRGSAGDLRVQSVTRSSPGGIVQVGRVEVQSAGSRNTQVALSGPSIDLQLTAEESDFFSYSSNSYRNSSAGICPPFTWQPSLAKDVKNVYEIGVPMTPWGTRRLRATAFKPDVAPLEITIKFEPAVPEQQASADQNNVQFRGGYFDQDELNRLLSMPTGELSIELVNNSPFDLQDVMVLVGTTVQWDPPDDQTNAQKNNAGPYGQSMSDFLSPKGLVDVYHTEHIRGIAAGDSVATSFRPRFEVRQYWNLHESVGMGQVTNPRITTLGTARAWLVATLEESPLLQVDGARTEFVPNQELHVYVQEIPQGSIENAALMVPQTTEELEDSEE